MVNMFLRRKINDKVGGSRINRIVITRAVEDDGLKVRGGAGWGERRIMRQGAHALTVNVCQRSDRNSSARAGPLLTLIASVNRF